jgi:hypothetical protein
MGRRQRDRHVGLPRLRGPRDPCGRVLLGECKTSRNKSGTVTRSQYQRSQKALLETWGSDVVLVLTSPEQAVRAVQQALGLGERDRHAI